MPHKDLRGGHETPAVFCTQLSDNDNISVTNMAEYLAAEMVAEHSLPTPLRWTEHCSEREEMDREVFVDEILLSSSKDRAISHLGVSNRVLLQVDSVAGVSLVLYADANLNAHASYKRIAYRTSPVW